MGDLRRLEAALARHVSKSDYRVAPGACGYLVVEPPFDERDVTSILSGLCYMHANLAVIAEDVWAIRLRLEGDDDEEEEDESEDDGGQGPPA